MQARLLGMRLPPGVHPPLLCGCSSRAKLTVFADRAFEEIVAQITGAA